MRACAQYNAYREQSENILMCKNAYKMYIECLGIVGDDQREQEFGL